MSSSEHVSQPGPFDWVADLLDQLTPEPLRWLATQARAGLVEHWPSLADLLPGGAEPEGTRPDPSRAMGAHRLAHEEERDSAGDRKRGAIGRAKNASRFEDRAAAARELAAHLDPETTEVLTGALRDPSAEVAVAAGEALAGSTSQAARSALIAVVRNVDGYHAASVRASCLQALGRPRTADERALLADSVRDVQVEVCLAAIEVSGEVDDEAATDSLLALLADRSGFYLPATRLAAARAIASGSRSKPARVRELLRDERDPVVAATLEPAAGSDRP